MQKFSFELVNSSEKNQLVTTQRFDQYALIVFRRITFLSFSNYFYTSNMEILFFENADLTLILREQFIHLLFGWHFLPDSILKPCFFQAVSDHSMDRLKDLLFSFYEQVSLPHIQCYLVCFTFIDKFLWMNRIG